MMGGLLKKSLRDVRLGTGLFCFGLFGAEVLLAYVPATFYKDFSVQWLQSPFVRNALTAMVGTDLGETIGPWAIVSIAWAHPIVIALVCAHAILFCTRLPAGEIDRGTIDILLSLPASRTKLFLAESLLWLATGVAVLAAAALGNAVGGAFAPSELRASPMGLLVSALNLFALYVAVGGVAWVVSSLCDRRGKAIGGLFAFVVVMLLLNYLAPFQKVVERLSILSFLHYYRPVFVLRDAHWPLKDLLVLLTSGAAFWLTGWTLFARRDIATT